MLHNLLQMCCLLQGSCVRNVWILASPSLVLLGPPVMLFHREASSACVHLAGRENCAKTVSEFIVIFTAILCHNDLCARMLIYSDQLVVCFLGSTSASILHTVIRILHTLQPIKLTEFYSCWWCFVSNHACKRQVLAVTVAEP